MYIYIVYNMPFCSRDNRRGLYVEGGREGSYEVRKQSAMGERSEDGFGGFWVARI